MSQEWRTLAEWGGVLVASAGGAGGVWVALDKLLAYRAARRAASGAQLLQLVDQLQEELARVQAVVQGYSAEIERLRTARWALDDTLWQLRDAAIAARGMVHELERRMGVRETQFDRLPGHPFAPDQRAP